ncbi:MAG: type IV pilus modification protein PilV [Chromatiales bacterium 21-64-14]|nr:MAG: type IV pilus modification protein PilV [Chromatiales bacterium 21-64-14]HQU16870.1 type IV pilus modification protein PilV [Gammaproteobacteria bacterium]
MPTSVPENRPRWRAATCTQEHGQRGVGLVDVLIALVVLSIGLLGLAGLQAKSLKFNHSAYLKSQATLQAYDMADRMRANMPGVTAGDYNAISGIAAAPANCTATNCNSGQMAQFDAFQWNTDNRNLLPSGQGTVTRNGNAFTITVMWDDQRTGATGTACSGNPKVDLTCFQTSFQP